MEATIVDLRYKMNDVLKALERNEKVNVKYRGKIKGTIVPNKVIEQKAVEEHSFFGMMKHDQATVEEVMQKLRGNRY